MSRDISSTDVFHLLEIDVQNVLRDFHTIINPLTGNKFGVS